MASQWQEIDLGKLSDRELLLLTATRVNALCIHVARQNGRLGKSEERLDLLEGWRNRTLGVLAVVTAAISVAISVAVAVFVK